MSLNPVEAAGKNPGRAILPLLCVLASSVLAFPCLAVESVALAWDPSVDASVVGYHVYYGTASGIYSGRISVTNTTATVPGLREGVRYFFVVTAFDGAGLESIPSNEVSYTVPGTSLSIQRVQVTGYSSAFHLSSAGMASGPWALQATEDFKTWRILGRGTNKPINILVLAKGPRAMFFRLVSP